MSESEAADSEAADSEASESATEVPGSEVPESESEAAESDGDLSCTICNSLGGQMNYYYLTDGRIVCNTCYDADDTLPAVDRGF